MLERYKADPRDVKVVAALTAGGWVFVNLVFYFLSQRYFQDRAASAGPVSDAHITQVRTSFAIFATTVGVAGIAAAWAPRIVGHSLAALAGLIALAGAFASYSKDLHIVLPASLFIVATVFPVLTWKSLARSRPAWAFLLAMCSVFAGIMMFASTKVRNVVGINLYFALILPGLLIVASVALALVRREYRESN